MNTNFYHLNYEVLNAHGAKLRACLVNGLTTSVGLLEVISFCIRLIATTGSLHPGEFYMDKEYRRGPSKWLQGTVGWG